jgi:hypothetical protein
LLKQRGELTDENIRKLELRTTKQIIKDILQPIIDQDIIGSEEWIAITGEFNDLRNKVIHDAYEPTQKEVIDAMVIVKSFNKLLNEAKIKN